MVEKITYQGATSFHSPRLVDTNVDQKTLPPTLTGDWSPYEAALTLGYTAATVQTMRDAVLRDEQGAPRDAARTAPESHALLTCD